MHDENASDTSENVLHELIQGPKFHGCDIHVKTVCHIF
jgi:hypothetical protein